VPLDADYTSLAVLPKKEEAMANPEDANKEKGEMRIMWIASAAIVLLILVAMGINMMMTHDTSPGSSTEPTNHAVVLPPK
jgi:flagellar basal body-associated protein FliL